MAKKEKGQRTKNALQNITHKTKDRVTRIPLKTVDELCVYIDMVQKQIEGNMSIVDRKMLDKSLIHI
jgi:hypothetical protein